MNPPSTATRWSLLFGLWLLYACFGLIVSSSAPLVNVIVQDLGISLSAMGLILGAWPLVYLFTAMPSGVLLDRVGPRYALTAGGVLLALSGFLRAIAVDEYTLFLAIAVFGLGGPMVSVGGPKLISVWFDGQARGTALGIYITGPVTGSVLGLTLTNSVMMPLTGDDWRLVMAIYGAITLLVAMCWYVLSRDAIATVNAGEDERDIGEQRVFIYLLKQPVVQIVLIISVASFMLNHGLNNWLPEMLRQAGMTPTQAGFWAALPTLVGIIGALLIPRLATETRRIPMLVGLCLCGGVALLVINQSLQHDVMASAWIAPGLITLGIARSALMPVAMLILMEAKSVGSRYMGVAGGLFFTAGEIGGVSGPLIVGFLADWQGDFVLALYLLTGLFGLMAAVTSLLKFAR